MKAVHSLISEVVKSEPKKLPIYKDPEYLAELRIRLRRELIADQNERIIAKQKQS
jgi:hypothetical protein